MTSVISGSNTQSAEMFRSFVFKRSSGESKEHVCSVIRLNEKIKPEWAAFANAAIAHCLEIDDGHRYATGLHPGAVIFSVALALSEAYNLPHNLVKRAIIAGYETACHIGRIINPEHRNRSFHSAGTVNTLGASITAGILFNLRSEQLQSALGFSASMASGIFSFLNESADAKLLHMAHAAWAGIVSVMLVNEGLHGPSNVLENKEGFIKAFAPDTYQSLISKGFSIDTFEINNVYFKPWGTCGHSFSTIEACMNLRKKLLNENKTSSDIRKLKIETYFAAATLKGNIPKTIHEAQYHLPFIAITTLIYGEITEFTILEALKNDDVHDIINTVTLLENVEYTSQFPKTRTSKVQIVLDDGKVFEEVIHIPLGMPDNPLSTPQIFNKFIKLTEKNLNPENQKKITHYLEYDISFDISSINCLLQNN